MEYIKLDRNECTSKRLEGASVEGKMMGNCLLWFGICSEDQVTCANEVGEYCT